MAMAWAEAEQRREDLSEWPSPPIVRDAGGAAIRVGARRYGGAVFGLLRQRRNRGWRRKRTAAPMEDFMGLPWRFVPAAAAWPEARRKAHRDVSPRQDEPRARCEKRPDQRTATSAASIRTDAPTAFWRACRLDPIGGIGVHQASAQGRGKGF